MSYQKHPEFITPPEETKIFRYMSFEKFLALLETQTLFFPSLDILAKQDIYEGEYSDVNKATDNITWAGLPQDSKDQFKTETMFNKYKELKKQNRQFIRNQRKIIFANCWHMQEHESAAMWKTYAQNQKGIAVTSTVGKFINSLRDYKDFNVMIGGIDYLDFSVHAVNEGNMLIPFMCKRRFFDYEKELRALIWTAENGKNPIEAEKIHIH